MSKKVYLYKVIKHQSEFNHNRGIEDTVYFVGKYGHRVNPSDTEAMAEYGFASGKSCNSAMVDKQCEVYAKQNALYERFGEDSDLGWMEIKGWYRFYV